MTVPKNCQGERTNNGDFSPSDSIQSSEWGAVAFETQKARLFIGNDDKHTKHRNNSISLSKKSWRIILRCPNAKIGAGQNCLHIVLKNVTVLLKHFVSLSTWTILASVSLTWKRLVLFPICCYLQWGQFEINKWTGLTHKASYVRVGENRKEET